MLLDHKKYQAKSLMSTPVMKKASKFEAFDRLAERATKLGENELIAEVVLFDAALAQYVLEKYHKRNRRISYPHIETIKHDLRNDNWKLSGQAVVINNLMELDDGQHRLLALAALNTTAHILVVFGADPEAFHVYDTGKKRSSADLLSIMEVPNGSYVSALLTMHAQIEICGRIRLTSSDVLGYVNAYGDDLQEAVHEMMRLRTAKIPHSPAAVGTFCFRVLQNSKFADKLHGFIEEVTTGVGLQSGSPTLKLRNLLMSRTLKGNDTTSKYRQMNSFIYCWNAYLEGRKVHAVRLPKDIKTYHCLDIT